MATLTVYPSLDGRIYNDESTGSWANCRAGTGGILGVGTTSATDAAIQGERNTNYNLSRCAYLFDTSALTAAATISAATFSVYSAAGGSNTETVNPANLTICASSPASNTSLATSDFNNFGTTKLSDTVLSLTTFNTTQQYYDFALNASGLSAISKTSITKLAIRSENDYSDSTAPGGNPKRSYGLAYFSEQTGTSNDPKLVITYTAAAGPANLKSFNGVAKASIKSINGTAIGSIKSVNGVT